MSAKIISLTRDGRPLVVAFRFAVPLESASLRWLQWKDSRFVPFQPPRVGESVVLHAPPGGMQDVLRR